jgi:hypothetical protein
MMKIDKEKANRLLAVAVVGLGIGYVLLLGYLIWGNVLGVKASTRTTSPSARPATINLWNAYGQAHEAAHAQSGDARLVSASTQWHGVSESALLDGTVSWTFVFYSPAENRSLDVVVNAGEARMINQTQVWNAPTTLAEGAWQAGPGDALLAFLACEGRTFLDKHPQAVVDLHLAAGDGGKPMWSIVAMDAGSQGLLALLVDAETGQVLSTRSS